MYSTIYWITRLDAINGLFIAGAVISAVIIAGSFVAKFINDDIYGEDHDDKNVYRRWRIPAVFVGIPCLLLSILIPTKNEAILIYAGGKTYDYIQKDTAIKKLPSLTTEYIKAVLEAKIKEAKDK